MIAAVTLSFAPSDADDLESSDRPDGEDERDDDLDKDTRSGFDGEEADNTAAEA